ncbi:MAG: cytochrome C oxidase subunit IV family protein [Deltaproteobacteria bacterium]
MDPSTLSHEHHASPTRYLVVWLLLLGFTVLTWRLTYADLGTTGLIFGMAIAATKATLVALFFMHLWDQSGINRLVFVIALTFIGILIGLVVADVSTRFYPAVAHGPVLHVPRR